MSMPTTTRELPKSLRTVPLNLVLMLASVTTFGCDRHGPNDATSPKMKPYVPMVLPAASTLPASLEERKAEERRVMEKLMAVLKPDQRSAAREILETNVSQIYNVRDNPEATRLIARLYALRDAEREDQRLAMMQEAATKYVSPVTVALVDRFAEEDLRARVIRDPKVHPDNIVVFSRAALTSQTVAAALEQLNVSRLRHGEIANHRVELRITSDSRLPPLSAEQVAWAEQLIRALQSAHPQDVPHVGRAQSLSIEIAPVSAASHGSPGTG